MVPTDKDKKSDRRNYFRIEDVSILYHRVLSGEEAVEDDNLGELSIEKLTLKARFESLSREMSPLSTALQESSPKLAQYLSAIDKKLNMLSEVIMDCAVDELDEKPQKVNISAGGLSFNSAEEVAPGSILELRVVLLPTNIGVYSHARVVLCSKNPDEEDSYKVAVEFIHMNDEFRDLISRHVLSREQAAIVSSHKTDI